jgi:hypothetical protein
LTGTMMPNPAEIDETALKGVSALERSRHSSVLLTLKFMIEEKTYGEITMPEENKKKKGFLSTIRESMNKTGGCCGAGETCGCSTPATGVEKTKGKDKKETPPE